MYMHIHLFPDSARRLWICLERWYERVFYSYGRCCHENSRTRKGETTRYSTAQITPPKAKHGCAHILKHSRLRGEVVDRPLTFPEIVRYHEEASRQDVPVGLCFDFLCVSGGSKVVINFPWIFLCNAEFSLCWALPE